MIGLPGAYADCYDLIDKHGVEYIENRRALPIVRAITR